MFFHVTPPKPTPTKKFIYLILTTILGILLSFLICTFIEIKYFNWVLNNQWAQENPSDVMLSAKYALHPALRIALLLVGAIGGFFLGRVWWRKVYIEQYWYKKFSKLK